MWLKTVQELVTALLLLVPSTPVCVAVGHGVVCAPVKLTLRCMTPTTRAGWYDRHQEVGCPAPMEVVLVLEETTKGEQ